MKMMMRNLLILNILITSGTLFAQEEKKLYKISGFILDEVTEAPLPGANIYVKNGSSGDASDQEGYFEFFLGSGQYTIVYTYIGYETLEKEISLTEDRFNRVYLTPEISETETIVATAKRPDDNVSSVQMSVASIDAETINQIPVVLGEADLIRSIQLLPGVSTVAEGVSGFSVRGGNFDQNLVLLDQAPLLNPSHLFGFFSVFNTQATSDLTLYKGGIPASYGGRLSSVLDVRQRTGNTEIFQVQGGIGLISSRLLFEGPIGKNGAGSYLIAGRRSYGDLFLPLFNIDNTAFFYDLNWNLKLNVSSKDFLSFYGYHGTDKFEIAEVFGNLWGNTAVGLSWNRIFNSSLVGKFSLIYTYYDYGLDIFAPGQDFAWRADLGQSIFQTDFSYSISDNLITDFGVRLAYYNFQPGQVNPIGSASATQSTSLDKKYGLEPAVYLNFNQEVSPSLSLQYGLRLSAFRRLGPQTMFIYENDQPVIYNQQLGRHEPGRVVDSVKYSDNQSIADFYGLEPRFIIRWSPNVQSAIKFSYNRMKQYIHLISNTTTPNPLDLWTPSGPYLEPQYADQIALGYFRNFDANNYETSVEVYYKKLYNQVDYIDGANLILNNNLETELLGGEGRAYGVELYLKKNSGRLTGWISYTLSRAEKRVPGINSQDPGINNGQFYPANYDKLHDLSVTGTFKLNKTWSFSANFIYATGRPITFPTGRYQYAGLVLANYESRNGNRMPDYHRLDISATLHGKLGGDWIFGIYNVYNRMNASSITFQPNEENPIVTEAVRTTIFGFVPSVTYSFSL